MEKWICSVCGNVYQGDTPPELCPVCKVTASHYTRPGEKVTEKLFEEDLPDEKFREAMAGVGNGRTSKKWVCSVCGHVHEGIAPPELCPVCKVTASGFRPENA